MVATGGMNLYPCNKFEQSLEYRKFQGKITALEQRVKELEAENGNMDSMYQDRMLDLEAKYEAELSTLRAEQPKCFACGTPLDSYSKCTACYDKLGAECDRLREIAYPDGPEKDAAVPMVTYEAVYDEVHKLRADNERLVKDNQQSVDCGAISPAPCKHNPPCLVCYSMQLKAKNERLNLQIKRAQNMFPFLRDDEAPGGGE